MKKGLKNSISLALIVGLITLCGCSSRPPLKQVNKSAQEHEINTPEQAQALKETYSK